MDKTKAPRALFLTRLQRGHRPQRLGRSGAPEGRGGLDTAMKTASRDPEAGTKMRT
ncbi:MAG: hypothetical protein ACJ8G1_10860 [Vitreoscilla sp.]|jgi:hypothetical protein